MTFLTGAAMALLMAAVFCGSLYLLLEGINWVLVRFRPSWDTRSITVFIVVLLAVAAYGGVSHMEQIAEQAIN